MARKKAQGGGSDPNAWMVTFSDLLTLMLTFFVLLLTMSSLDTKKLKEAFDSFLQMAGTESITGPPSLASDQASPYNLLRKTFIKTLASSGKLGSDLVAVPDMSKTGGFPGMKPVEQTPEEASEEEDKNKDVNEEPPPEEMPGMEFIVQDNRLIVRFPASITFASGRADLLPKFKEVLGILADSIEKNKMKVLVEGHTDNVPINTLQFPSNWELSLARGARVARFLVDECGMPAGDVAAAGYADRRAIATNKTPEGREKNRRVDVILSVPEEKKPDKKKP
ncbi:MAG TPA: flagellar motor protein MotB [bacterium]|nr:flagellar motor protein MotB [bacterium]